MKKVLRIARILLILIFTGGIVHASYRALNWLLIPTSFNLAGSHTLSKDSLEKVSEFIEEKLDYKTKSLKDVAHAIKNQFSHIKHVMITQAPNGLNVKLKPRTPRFIINNEKILIDSGQLISKYLFNKDAYSMLPALTIDEAACESGCLNYLCHKSLCMVPGKLFKAYDFWWQNKEAVWLTCKEQPHFVILTDAESIGNKQKLQLCCNLKKDIELKKEFSFKKSMVWIADIRFDNQVIVFSRGGKGHGYNTFT